ncbi:hypothetical protein [Mesorhizobium sp. M7A.F.Ca.ET.027.03.2.1]|uniref:hypothetical protein n=1 Tax=Mesorhizobium sp. M7A.F.Ca.ET.027.03.2.1 TaxID=2496656 RepID=UPI000FCC7A72|nr:hypothetical protein [Mesorhizobium sp. M7A.F.Ca.ET.027.03.2.1]RVD66388.1 hypothetical protein EN750_03635 [Mesorhizobium sp. M7A.F.Ca.ET.027.03.2.1]
MPELEGPNMSRHEFSIAYDGAERVDDHTMDVENLAPALLGFGKLIREANTEFNGNKAKARVLVVSDFEHKCFQVNFEAVLTYYEYVRSLIESSPIKTAKEVLEWIGIFKPTGVGVAGYLSYLGYLKVKRGRKIESKTEITDQNGQGVVAIRFEGDHNEVHVHHHIHNLGENPKALAATRDALSPIGRDGFTSLGVRKDDQFVETIDASSADAILASCNAGPAEKEPSEPDVDPTTAWLSVYGPVYDEKADKWRFKLGTDHIYADISETTIAKDALDRGGAMVDDTYQVRLEITTPKDENGKKGKPAYKILEVLRFVPATPSGQQLSLIPDDKQGQ